jgi:flagellar basal-body rod modification protein FlgD
MTTVPGVTGTGSSSANNNNAAKANVDYQSFLKLLVAQLKNQDPTNPMDSTQYMAQLASFSQVEQSIQINTKLDELLQASQLSQAGSIIGKTITSADGEMTGTVSEVRLYSDGIVAVLENGDQVLVGPGVTISDTAPADAA